MAKTKFERVESGREGTAIFKIVGKLGFHENTKVKRLVEECRKRDFDLVIFDFTELSSLGGGVARILREFARDYEEKGHAVHFVVTKDVILEFLQNEEVPLKIFGSMDEAVVEGEKAESREGSSGDKQSEDDAARFSRDEEAGAPEGVRVESTGETIEEGGESGAGNPVLEKTEEVDSPGIILMAYDGVSGDGGEGGSVKEGEETGESIESGEEGEGSGENDGASDAGAEEIISEIFNGEEKSPPEWIKKPVSPLKTEPVGGKVGTSPKSGSTDISKQLKKRILELKTLFSLSRDFNAVRDRRKLMDIFLLTSIAEGGVESALFLENIEDVFRATMAKGLDREVVDSFEITANEEILNLRGDEIHSLDALPIADGERERLKNEGIRYICAFDIGDELIGLVALGKRIAGRGMKEEDFEFLKILVNIAKSAYENALLFEREHERTLGIVKTLISLIEENTLLKGTSEFVSRYVGMVAKNIGYPEENFKDLIYGTVLRDMGMIKVSDLILRSPRELTKEEWEIIKRHPEDGAEMLARMKFSDHVTDIVRTHHERFNGEGYPYGLRGREIPLGSRIISVVESYAAMIHERPNRPALSEVEALETLKENYGLRYDREIVDVFVRIIEKELARSVQAETEESIIQ